MKKIFLFLLFISNCFFVSAQDNIKGNIHGTLITTVGSPVEYATLSVTHKASGKTVGGTTSAADGSFKIDGLEESVYALLVEALGYESYQLDSLSITQKNTIINLGTIRLTKSATTLGTVTVTASKSLVENKIDKLVFNAEKDLTSQTGAATDVLKKVPQVSVDVDGNVQLAGSSSIRFLINGRPSAAFGNNVADVLQSIPASQIKSIEIVTNPGARYDAQGLGGIINIILKQSKVNGVNGNISLTAGTRAENGSFNLNARRGNLGLNAFVSGNARLKATTPSGYRRVASDEQAGTQAILEQEGNYAVKRQGYQTGFGFDWTANKKNAFGGSVSFNRFGNSGDGYIFQTQQINDLVSGNAIETTSTGNYAANKFTFRNTDASLNYKRTFVKEDQELEITYNISSGHSRSNVANFQLTLPGDSVFYGISGTNPAKEKEQELNINYTQPLGNEITLGTGGKINYFDINSSSSVNSFDAAINQYKFNNSLSNALSYKQKVYAVYAELSFPVKKLFEAKIGGRYERTEIDAKYSNAQQQVNVPGYNTFVPSVFASKKLGEKDQVKLSYSKRIERPDYGDLNPFINTADPKNIVSGNPFLLPETGHRIEFSFTHNFKTAGSVMVTLFNRIKERDIQPYLVFFPTLVLGDSTYNNVTVSTRQNIGTEKDAGLNIFTDAPIGDKLTLRGNFSLFYRHTVNALDKGNNSSSWNYRANINAAYQFDKNLAVEFFGNFNSARNELQGKYPSFTSYSMAVRRQIWKKKGSLALVANNPFNNYINQKTQLYGPGFVVESYRKIPFRSVGLNFTWKFGKLEFKDSKPDNPVQSSGLE